MIRNLQKKDPLQTILNDIMEIVARVSKSQNTSSIYFISFFYFLSFFCAVSVLFINNPLEPVQTNQIFKFFIISQMTNMANINPNIILIIFLVFTLILNILFVLNYNKTPFDSIVHFLAILISISTLMHVPLAYYLIENIADIINNRYQSQGILILKAFFSISCTLALIQTLIFVYFEIRPLRTSNILWNYGNLKLFYGNLMEITRAFVIYFDGISIVLLSVSLVIQGHLYQTPSSYLYPKTILVDKYRNLLIIFVHISLILGEVFQNKQLCFIIICFTCFGCFIIFTLDFISVNQACQQIPKCCFENSALMYNFYIDYRQKNKNTSQQLMKIISAHYLACDSQNCIFKQIHQSNTKQTNQDLQQKISKFLKNFRYRTPQSQLLYEIWKIQLNKTVSLTHKHRDFSLIHKFVVNYVLGPEDSTKKDLMTATNNNNITNQSLNQKCKFYKQLNCVIDQFEKMAEVMSKPLPQLNQVIDVVVGIHCQTQSLTKLFEEMIKIKQVNYFCIQLYLKFFECFLDDSKLSTDILDRLKRLKILGQSDYIEQNPLPCFMVDAYTKNIEKVNAQALKFLKAHRYEVKDKNFSNIVLPSFNLKQLYSCQIQNQKQQYIPIFFKIKNINETIMVCRNIKMKRLQQNNKNYYEITVHKKNYGCNIIEILIDQNQNIVASTRSFVLFPSHNQKMQNKIQLVYEKNIKPILKQISQTKIGRIQFGQRCLIAGLIIQKFCPYAGMRLLSINLVKKVNNSRNQKRISNIRLSKLYSTQTQFSFYYRQGSQDHIVLEGSQCKRNNEQSGLNDTIQMRTINQKVNVLLANMAFPNIINHGVGIKVYRLYNKQLYNIDLQDRARYEQQFSGINEMQSSKSIRWNVNENFFIVILIVLALLITGCSIFLNITVDNQLAFIQQQQGKLLKIQQFSLNFNRIMASLRDIANGFFKKFGRDYNAIVMDSYEELQSIDSSDFFSQKDYVGNYGRQTYKGSLSQLIQVCLAHVYQYIQVTHSEIIELIHGFAIEQLGPKLTQQKDMKKESILKSSETLSKYSLICFIFIVSGSILYFILFLLLSQKFKKNMDSFLQPLLITSQPEIKRISQQCQKFKNVIISLFKNYQVDLQVISSRKQKISKRSRPKLTNFGFSSIIVEFFFGGFVVLVLISLAFVQYNSTVDEIKRVNKLFSEGQAVMEVYSGLCWITNQIDHTGIIDVQKINSLSNHLTLIQNFKDKYQFSPQLTTLVSKVFFSDSCQYLKQNKIISDGWCGDRMIGFTLRNPFKLSLDLYFRRINYYLITNITDTYASSGIYSDPFKQLFKHFSKEINKYTYNRIIDIRSNLLIMAILVSIMSFSLVVILIIAIIYFQEKIKTINNGLVSLSGQNTTQYHKQHSKRLQNQPTKNKDKENITEQHMVSGVLQQEQMDQVREY